VTEKTPNHELSAMSCPVSLEDVDLFSHGAQEHWYEAYQILHDHSPVHVIPGEGIGPGSDGFILTRYSDIARVVRDPDRFKPTLSLAIEARNRRREQREADRRPPGLMNAMIESMATLRPTKELWRAHRQELTDPWVGPGANRHTDMITKTADALIDRWIDDGQVELVSAFARPLPQIVMANVLGFPLADLAQLEKWGNATVAAFVHGKGHRNLLAPEQVAEQAERLEEFRIYVQEQIDEKRRQPGDDMITFLTQVTYRALGRTLKDPEINGVVDAMVIGGLETTQYALEEQAQLLCDDPELYREIRADRSKLRPFLEEAMRLRAPTQGLSTRMTTRDEVFSGVPVPKGLLLHLRWAAGNVDADQYECPHAIDLGRKRISSHLTFSQGLRTCPGAGISRLEQSIAWNRLLDRIERLEYAPGNRFLHQPGIMLGTLELQLQFAKAA
jgi:cytochrome P450